MMKQRVFLVVFLILALVVSGLVYVAARRQDEMNRRRALRLQAADLPSTFPGGKPGELPKRSVPLTPTEAVQRHQKTLEDIQRINRLNEESRRRSEQRQAPPPKQ